VVLAEVEVVPEVPPTPVLVDQELQDKVMPVELTQVPLKVTAPLDPGAVVAPGLQVEMV